MKPEPAKTCPSCGERYDADVLFCPRDGTPLGTARTSAPSSGDSYLGVELAGQIRLKHLIGMGSMGRVYKAWQQGIERDVAVKVLHRELSGNAELVSRFHREAKVSSRLIHPNVVQVLMTGCLPLRADPRLGGELYLVMEFLDGISLLSALAAAGAGSEGAALPLTRALHIVLQICDAVGEAHAQNIVHRDLKPENVMLVKRGDDPDYVKVLDFGIARLDWADRSMATQAGLIFGTAKYISPEGAEGLPVGPAADVYSIATILYQCLAGRPPFEGDSPVALLVQHTHAPPPGLRSIARASYVPAPIAAVIMQSLAKKPEERAENARVFGRELVAAARAAGLDPEEIVSHSSLLLRGQGGVKLASRERTKALELSHDLARQIGGIAATESDPAGEGRPRASAPGSFPGETPPPRPSASAPPGPASGSEPPQATLPAAEEELALARASTDPAASPSTRASSASVRPPRASRPPPPALDFDDGEAAGRAEPQSSTMQGAEVDADGVPRRTPRARAARALALAACTCAALLVLLLGGRHFGAFGAAAQDDSLDTYLEAGRDCTRRHAWDSPPHDNLKEVTDRALARWPGEARVLELRRDAAERLVTDALGRKYAGDPPEALHLAQLALELAPGLTTAQHLVAELEVPKAPEVAPAASEGKEPERGSPRSTAHKTTPKLPPGATNAAVPTGTANGSPVLPQTPPPLPADSPPAPAPTSTGPWL